MNRWMVSGIVGCGSVYPFVGNVLIANKIQIIIIKLNRRDRRRSRGLSSRLIGGLSEIPFIISRRKKKDRMGMIRTWNRLIFALASN